MAIASRRIWHPQHGKTQKQTDSCPSCRLTIGPTANGPARAHSPIHPSLPQGINEYQLRSVFADTCQDQPADTVGHTECEEDRCEDLEPLWKERLDRQIGIDDAD